MRLLWKLLRKNISISQITGFAIANLLGIMVLLVGVQFFSDTRSMFSQSDGFMKNDYLIISKKVSMVGSVLGQKGAFGEKEIAEIRKQTFVESAGRFTSSDFRVYASIGLGGSGISSDIFFESVPDEYVDAESSRWSFREGDVDIPIIVPRNYLNLYNFGFSQSRGLPRLSESAISKVDFDVKITGYGASDKFKGRIVGFSNRLNTILVPDSFLLWANDRYGSKEVKEATRLIVEVKNTSDKALLAYFKDKGYEIEGNALDSGEMAYFARIITIVVLVIGLIVTLLSIYILILSLYLLLEKNASKIETLMLMGYSPWKIIAPYSAVVALLNFAIMVVALIAVLLLRGYYVEMLTDIYPLEDASVSTVYLVAGVLYISIMLINLFVIRRRVFRISR